MLYCVKIYAQNSNSVQSETYQKIIQYELPKQYLMDNKSKLYPKEHMFRRAEMVFFLSIPAAFFVVQNLLNIFNSFNILLLNYNSDLGRDVFGFTSGEWNFALAAIFLIPLGVTIQDQIFVQYYPLTLPFSQERIRETRVNFSIYRTKF